ncbi:S-methyl-5-thioribose-1-phosphate isomerase [Yamadazyma tenuis]|uniref:Methylthioribose-1-phosphate isomerase n=1 Tax=Candida tenuis (strain ATCC 10573 / BCRC 21748 / CBS 615 / JCM 9827 / NBRC 10315 / NRRL Y-1498 / VKM Y-70) TaxID=590646 RepID=G3AYD9_CANTC|nr:putative translation initiation factor [Yamadazyma tenuis ATCC 10573]EGV65829.1 putative translation initiation factor [Yamadazyma tenuis ATCC 10573]WEJ95841.1 S-methyl-5-thioribose-1-phosphate isomerase [Yamadazyma tenuis]
MSSDEKTLKAIKFNKNDVSLDILDQLLLPYTTKYIEIQTIEDAFQAIKKMQVRGAPAIAIVGAFAIAVEVFHYLQDKNSGKTVGDLIKDIDYLVTSRPTAVNLSNACNEIKDSLKKYDSSSLIVKEQSDLILDYAVNLYEDDLANNFKIGDNGVEYIKRVLNAENFKGPFSIMTICNTGSLATSGHGTALGIIRSAYSSLQKDVSKEEFFLEHVYPCETRPYNQGAKLTSYELNYEKIPFTLICDNMASALISTLNKSKAIKQSTAPVKFIIVGADRVVSNGDTANKIGTFQLSTISNHFNGIEKFQKIKFIVAAPKTTIDYKTQTGDDIIIEERPANELTSLKGPVIDGDKIGEKLVVGIAPPGISVWNPAFDVTPHELIDSIITEDPHVFEKNSNGEFELQ